MKRAISIGARLCFLAAAAALLGSGAIRSAGGESTGIIQPSEIKPGMKGYGLTVFAGNQIEKFEVEAIDVIPNALLKQDLILCRLSGHNLEKTRVIAGMSGSPVYFDGRLAGAVAYGFSFGQDPITMLTPIQNMIDSQNKAKLVAEAGPAAETAADFSKTGIVPVTTPLLAGGFSPAGLQALARELGPYGFIPLAGGRLGSAELDPAAAKAMSPGDAIGAALITGDLSLVAIGTLTWREGNRIAAFGHPFLQAGPISMPLTSARIHTVIASQSNSFKLGSVTAVVGALTMDDQAAISGELGKTAETIPFHVKIKNLHSQFEEAFTFFLCKDKFLSPLLVNIALDEALAHAVPTMASSTVRVKTRLTLAKYGPAEYEDVYPVRSGNFSSGFLEPIMFLARNPFEDVRLEAVDLEIALTDEFKVAMIDSARTDTDEVTAGGTVGLTVTLRPYGGAPAVNYRFQIKVPEGDNVKALRVMVTGGMRALPDAAPPDSIPDMIKFMKALYPTNFLVVTCLGPGLGVDLDGNRLRGLPPSVVSMLQPPNATLATAAPELLIQAQETPYVIGGQQRIMLKVRNPGTRKK